LKAPFKANTNNGRIGFHSREHSNSGSLSALGSSEVLPPGGVPKSLLFEEYERRVPEKS